MVIRRLLSTGFFPCPRCGGRRVHGILTWGENFNGGNTGMQRWYYVNVRCRSRGCGCQVVKSKCFLEKDGQNSVKRVVRRWFKSVRSHWNRRPAAAQRKRKG